MPPPGEDAREPVMDAVSGTPQPPAGDPVDPVAGVEEILSAVGEVAYTWTIPDDRIQWGANIAATLGIASADTIATGRAWGTLLDSSNLTSRHEAVVNGTGSDQGDGVPYDIEYAVFPDGPGTPRRLILQDTGRWYGDGSGRPRHAIGVVRIVNDRHEREQRLAFLSRFDELTGYFNRQHLLVALAEAIDNAKRYRASVAFMIVAIDNFRAINEAYGFETADQVFAAAARRIKAQLRDGDAVGRYSGNKLGLILANCDESDMHAAAERFHAAVRNGVITAGTSSVAVTVSIGGVALPRHARSVGEALARAQESLHRARLRGSGRFAAYAPSVSRAARRQSNSALSSEMVAAIDTRKLRLFFQPVVDTRTRKTVFFEGLLRLERSAGSFAPATDFITLCEQLGLIRLVDLYTLERTLEALVAHPTAQISVNVSGETVGDAEWLSRLASAVVENPDAARRLIVEITETAVIRSIDEAIHFVQTIHDLGARVAIDDFGEGFSSFRHLRSLKIDIVKIAGAFIERLPDSPDDQAFVRALSELAHHFGIEIVAEWVQDEATAALLAEQGVQMIQGTLTGLAGPECKPDGSVSPSPTGGRAASASRPADA